MNGINIFEARMKLTEQTQEILRGIFAVSLFIILMGGVIYGLYAIGRAQQIKEIGKETIYIQMGEEISSDLIDDDGTINFSILLSNSNNSKSCFKEGINTSGISCYDKRNGTGLSNFNIKATLIDRKGIDCITKEGTFFTDENDLPICEELTAELENKSFSERIEIAKKY